MKIIFYPDLDFTYVPQSLRMGGRTEECLSKKINRMASIKAEVTEL